MKRQRKSAIATHARPHRSRVDEYPSQRCHHTDDIAGKASARDSQRLLENHTADSCRRAARNTRKTSNPLWLRVFIPQQWLPIVFFCGCKITELSLFLAGTFMSWLVLTKNCLRGDRLQMQNTACNCSPCQLRPLFGILKNNLFHLHRIHLHLYVVRKGDAVHELF